jgi:hypothetical protein
MIARGVHKHTPVAQLNRPEFKKYIILALWTAVTFFLPERKANSKA